MEAFGRVGGVVRETVRVKERPQQCWANMRRGLDRFGSFWVRSLANVTDVDKDRSRFSRVQI